MSVAAVVAVVLLLLFEHMRGRSYAYRLGVQHMTEEAIRAAWRAGDRRVGEAELRATAKRLEDEA